MKEKLLVVTGDKVIADITKGVVHVCPEGYCAGAIVHRRDWMNRELLGVYGEAVYVDPKARDVKFVEEYYGLACTVFKGNKETRCIGYVKGKEVSWLV